MIIEEDQSHHKELVVRTNEEIKKQHTQKLSSLVAQEYKLKNISAINPKLEGLLLLYQRDNVLTKESDLQFASNELKNFPFIEEYSMKELSLTSFCFHLCEELKHFYSPLGEQLFSNLLIETKLIFLYILNGCIDLLEEEICFMLKGKVSIYKESTPQQMEENLVLLLKQNINSLNKEINDKSLKQKLNIFVETQYDKIIHNGSTNFKNVSHLDTNHEESTHQLSTTQFQQSHTRTKIKRKTKKHTTRALNKKTSLKVDEPNQTEGFYSYFSKDETHKLQPIIKEQITKALFKLIDQEDSSLSQQNIYVQQNQLLLWYQTNVDFFFNELGVPKYTENKSFYSGNKTSKLISYHEIKIKLNQIHNHFNTQMCDFKLHSISIIIQINLIVNINYFKFKGIQSIKQLQLTKLKLKHIIGQHFTSKIGEEDKIRKKQFIFAGDNLHMVTITRSNYESIQNFSDDVMREKLKLIQEKFKDISKNAMLKFIYYFKKKEFPRKQHIWNEKDKCSGLYFIISGEIEYVKSHRSRVRTARNSFQVQIDNYDLVKKTDQVTRTLNICTFQQGNFIGEEDIFDYSQRRIYSAVVKSDSVSVFHLDQRDFENNKKFIAEVIVQLTAKTQAKKSMLEQKWQAAIINFESKNKNSDSLTELLEDNNNQKSQTPLMTPRRVSNQNSVTNSPRNSQISVRQKIIETKEKTKFTNTNNIKEIDKLFRKEFGKKKYLQMIKNNPQVILSNSTLNSLESVMSLSDDLTKQDEKIKLQKNFQKVSTKARPSTCSTNQQLFHENIKTEEASSFFQFSTLEFSKKDSQKNKKNLRTSVVSVLNMNNALKFMRNPSSKKIADSFTNLAFFDNVSTKNQITMNGIDLERHQSQNGSKGNIELLNQQKMQSQFQQLLNQPSSSPGQNDQKVRGKIFSKKEKQQQKTQKLQDELNSDKFQNLKNYLSDKQLQHLAERKLKRQEDLKDINKLNIFEQQVLKQSLLQKPIRPGQKEMLTDDQKLEMKVLLSNHIEGKNERVKDHDFIFKSVSTPQAIKQMQFKINQKLKNKPGYQDNTEVKDKPWRQDLPIASTFLQQNFSEMNKHYNSFIAQPTNVEQGMLISSITHSPKTDIIPLEFHRPSLVYSQSNHSNQSASPKNSGNTPKNSGTPKNLGGTPKNFGNTSRNSFISQRESFTLKSVIPPSPFSIAVSPLILPMQQSNMLNSNLNEQNKEISDSVIENDQAIFALNYDREHQLLNTINNIEDKNKQDLLNNNSAEQIVMRRSQSNNEFNQNTQGQYKNNQQKEVNSPLLSEKRYSQSSTSQLPFQQNINKRAQSANPKSEFYRVQSPILKSRNHNPKFSSSNKQTSIQQANMQKSQQFQIPNEKTKIQSLVTSIKQLKKNVESIKMLNKSINNQCKSQSIGSPIQLYESKTARNSADLQIDTQTQERFSQLYYSPKYNTVQGGFQTDSSLNKQGQQTDQSNTNTFMNTENDLKRFSVNNVFAYNGTHHIFDNFALDSTLDNKGLMRPESAEAFKRSISSYSNVFTQYCQTLQDSAPLTIKSLKPQDFSSFDRIRTQPQTRNQSPILTPYNRATMGNSLISNLFISSDINGSPYNSNLKLTPTQHYEAVSLQSPRMSIINSRKLSETSLLQNPKIQKDSIYFQKASNMITPRNDKSSSQIQHVVTNALNKQQKILPFQRIHSASRGKQLSTEQVMSQIDTEYKKCKGLIIVPTNLLKVQTPTQKSIKNK